MEKIVLCGNSNVGKSTVFNKLARGHNHIGNWLGVTISAIEKEGSLNGRRVIFADLPGLNSVDVQSSDEAAAFEYLKENKGENFLNVCDVNNLRRNLFLTLEFAAMGLKMQILLNFTKKFKGKIDTAQLGRRLGGLNVVCEKEELKGFQVSTLKVPESAEGKHKLIEEILAACFARETSRPFGWSRADKILLNKYAALPIFIFVTITIFAVTFVLFPFMFGPPLDFVLTALGKVSGSVFYQDIIFGTLKTVLVFLPQVAGMLFCLYMLENSGYISRLAFLCDDFFVRIGLSGKSVFPMLLSFGCASVAVDFVKTIKNKNTQIKTAATLSLMPCSAKLPMCLAIFGLYLKRYAFFAICAVFFISIILALSFAVLLNKKAFKSSGEDELILEFPSLKLVSFSAVAKNAFDGTWGFLKRVFSVVLVLQIILFCLTRLKVDFGVIAPIFAPLGFDVRVAAAALIFGVVAKEMILTTAFAAGASLGGVLSPAAILAFLVFSLFYTPCASTVAGLNGHFGAKATAKIMWRQLCLAYVCSGVTYFAFGGRNFIFLIVVSVLVIVRYLLPKCARCCTMKS